MRMYLKAEELKKMGLPWKRVVPEEPQLKRKKIVLELLADDDFETLEERAMEFSNRSAGCRSAFLKYLKAVRPS